MKSIDCKLEILKNKPDILNLFFFFEQAFLELVNRGDIPGILNRLEISIAVLVENIERGAKSISFDFHFVLKHVKCVCRVVTHV